jgi:hypothetical protein
MEAGKARPAEYREPHGDGLQELSGTRVNEPDFEVREGFLASGRHDWCITKL